MTTRLFPIFKAAALFVAATVVSSLFFAQTLPQARAQAADKSARGEPIKPLAPKKDGEAPRGEPIKPLAPGATKPAESPKATVSVPGGDSEFVTVGFDKLSTFKYEVPEDNVTTNVVAGAKDPDEQIPQTVKDYNNKRIALKGFMLPLKVEGGLVTELLIMRDQSMCCYGAVPKINEWVSVKMTSKGVKPIMDQPITMMGKLKVGAIRENGYLVGIYAMDGERMEGPAL